MKGTEKFKEQIQTHLNCLAAKDELFAETLKKPNKNIDDCINHIFNEVQKSGCAGFADEEIYKMAIHYYDEDNLKVSKSKDCTVVVNHSVELTPEEIQDAKQKAIDQVFEDQRKQLTSKKQTKKVEQTPIVGSLFD